MTAPYNQPAPAPAAPLVMEARNLVKKYGSVIAMNGADFELRPAPTARARVR